MQHKSVTIVANPVVGERCHVFLLDTYISKLPPAAVEKNIFYCKPLSNVPTDPTNPWYLPVPVGRNLLGKMVQDMCYDAGIEGKKTNHSLRVSGASTLFEAGVPERVIQQRTGHRSLLSLRMYEQVSEGQEKAVSRILTGENNNYNESLMQSITSSSTLPSNVSCNESLIQSIASSSSLPSKVSCNESSSMLQSSIPSSKSSGIHCNKCTVNVYASPQISPVNFPSMPPVNFPSMASCYPSPFSYYNLPRFPSPYSTDAEEQ